MYHRCTPSNTLPAQQHRTPNTTPAMPYLHRPDSTKCTTTPQTPHTHTDGPWPCRAARAHAELGCVCRRQQSPAPRLGVPPGHPSACPPPPAARPPGRAPRLPVATRPAGWLSPLREQPRAPLRWTPGRAVACGDMRWGRAAAGALLGTGSPGEAEDAAFHPLSVPALPRPWASLC